MTVTTRTKEDVLNLLSENHARIEAFGVARIGLFGSFVRNEQSTDRDIDLLVEFRSGDQSFDNFMKLWFFLEELLQRRVDLVTTEGLSPYVVPIFLRRSSLPPPAPLEYLRHILDEAEHLTKQALGLSKERFMNDETLKRAFVRSIAMEAILRPEGAG